jgi:hypothetical protein
MYIILFFPRRQESTFHMPNGKLHSLSPLLDKKSRGRYDAARAMLGIVSVYRQVLMKKHTISG